MNAGIYVLMGLAGGVLSGAFGIGGGTLLVPLFVLGLGMSQHMAQGTALAVMLPPVFLLAVWRYYQEGHVNISVALFVALGFFLGGLIGAHYVQGIPDASLKRAFGVFLMVVGIKMALGR